MSEYVLHPEALGDLTALWDYIAEQNIDAADRLIDAMFHEFATIAAMPRIGHLRPDLNDVGISTMSD